MLSVLAVLLVALPMQTVPFEELAGAGLWDELVDATGEVLAESPEDGEALYWSGRALIERARVLREGRSFARDMAITLLRRAADQLGAAGDGVRADAREWQAYARYLQGVDVALPGDLERWFEAEASGYPAYLRGLIARDAADDDAHEWFARAVSVAPERATFALAWAEALGERGERVLALDAWGIARRHSAERGALLSTLRVLLPGESLAAGRLRLIEELTVESAGVVDGLTAWHASFACEQLGLMDEAAAWMDRATEGRTPMIERAHARLLIRLDRPTEALEMLEPLAVDGDAEAMDLLMQLSGIQGQRRNWDLALAANRIVLAIERQNVGAGMNRALTLSLSGRSLDGYRELLEMHHGRAGLLNDAGLAAWGWGRDDEAREYLERAVEMSGSVDARENLAALLLTDTAGARQRPVSLLDALVAEEPSRDRALFLRYLARSR